MFLAFLTGEALGNLTPLGLFVSEPTKAVFVRHRVPLMTAVSGLAIEKTPASVAVVIASGTVALLRRLALDARLSFETFVVGRSNTLAHAAAKQVAFARRGDAVMFNPLYVHAGVGLGKTHLLQADRRAGNAGTERKVLYLTAESSCTASWPR